MADSKKYHVSKRADDNKWIVKLEKGEKVIKTFNTKDEALDYVKKLADNQDASIAFHASKGANKGKIRKIQLIKLTSIFLIPCFKFFNEQIKRTCLTLKDTHFPRQQERRYSSLVRHVFILFQNKSGHRQMIALFSGMNLIS